MHMLLPGGVLLVMYARRAWWHQGGPAVKPCLPAPSPPLAVAFFATRSYITFCTTFWTLHVRSILFIVQVGAAAELLLGGWPPWGGWPPRRGPRLLSAARASTKHLQLGQGRASCCSPWLTCSPAHLLSTPPPCALPLLLQSSAHSAAYLESRIEAFLPQVGCVREAGAPQLPTLPAAPARLAAAAGYCMAC